MNKRIPIGISKIKKNKVLLTIPTCYLLLITYIYFVIKKNLKQLNIESSMRAVYTNTVFWLCVCIALVGLLAIVVLIGIPIGNKNIQEKLRTIGFVDANGSPPLLLSVDNIHSGIVLEFFSPYIPLGRFINQQEAIGTAINIRIIDVIYGKDMQHIKIKAVQGKGGKAEMLLWDKSYLSPKDFELVLGESYFGIEKVDISNSPHILLGGASGSGKTILLKLLLEQIHLKKAEIFLCDMKGGVDFGGRWRKICNIITEPQTLNSKLDDIIQILEERRMIFFESETPNIAIYNQKTGSELPRIFLVCDEIAEILDKTGLEKDEKTRVIQIESKLATIARQGRAFGLHLILATQRPSAEILKGEIKTNLSIRICGRADKVLSQIILDNSEGADKILPDDHGMFLTNTGVLFRAYYIDDNSMEMRENNP